LGKLLAAENSEQLERLLARLPEHQADALRLRFFAGLKFEEIASTMGCSLSTSKNRVKWGLLKMSQLLKPDSTSLSSEIDRHESPPFHQEVTRRYAFTHFLAQVGASGGE